MAKRKDIDWAAIEADYRAGSLSIRRIAAKHGVSEAAVRKQAAAAKWVRTDCAPAHQPRTKPAPASEPEQEVLPPERDAPRLPPPALNPELAADPVALSRDLAQRLLHELDATTSQLGDVEDAIYEDTKDDASPRRRSAMLKAVSLPARAMTLKTIAQTIAVLGEVGGAGKKGKKEQRQEAAVEAGRGRFAPRPPPKLVVDNG
ncbi:terminase [Azospirillum thermophilum]|uniref:Terminase n=1 Tax=Azospirillum thermophilum TaxID=2202148 RepID=A0A2S2D0L7_9PROT|nr:terminase [Azospirillum thermophilum]AWK90301.1 terminase [Azospirillum thermophilum]